MVRSNSLTHTIHAQYTHMMVKRVERNYYHFYIWWWVLLCCINFAPSTRAKCKSCESESEKNKVATQFLHWKHAKNKWICVSFRFTCRGLYSLNLSSCACACKITAQSFLYSAFSFDIHNWCSHLSGILSNIMAVH